MRLSRIGCIALALLLTRSLHAEDPAELRFKH